jgi:hypothetical protein
MNPRELVNHVRSGPEKLVLDTPLPRFRRRTRSNPCDFNEFLEALQSSETIRMAMCRDHHLLGISEDEWVLLVKRLGSIKGIQRLTFYCTPGSCHFHPFRAVADAVHNAQLLYNLAISLRDGNFPRDPSGLLALADALRQHTTLQEFAWVDRLEAVQDLSADVVLRALPACPHLREVTIMTKCASTEALQNLLQLHKATGLVLALTSDHWLAVVDEIRQGRCNIRVLHLTMIEGTISGATKAVQKIANAIRFDSKLERLTLKMENGFTDEAGLSLAEALTVNTTLRKITLSINSSIRWARNRAALGVSAHQAFSAMLRVNTSLALKLPPLESAVADERLIDSRNQMLIEQRLNKVGRGRLLASRQTTREEWVYALHESNSRNVSRPPALQVSCLYSLLHMNPSVVCMA